MNDSPDQDEASPDPPLHWAPEGPEALTPKHKAALVHRIRMLMEYWSITPEDLERADIPARPEPPEAPVKYRHPISGETWNGIGAHPEWLRNALLKEGYTVKELRDSVDAES